MKKSVYFYLYILLVTLTSQIAFSQVWISENEWNKDYEKEYSEWVRSDSVKKDLFTNKRSPYYGITLDCADFTYAMRIIFSYENKLDFKVRNPVYSKRSSRALTRLYYWGIELDKWNKYEEGTKRVKAFMKFIASSLGTEALSYYDSYPLHPETVQPGDFFTYKITKDGEYIRHSYNIKNVTEVGFFDVIYSTQLRAKQKKSLGYTKNFSLFNRPLRNNWGFKRFKRPELQDLNYDEYPSETGYNLIQYKKAKELSDKKFFKWVSRLLKTKDELPDETIKRHLSLICKLSKTRVETIQGGETFRLQIKNRCMNAREYDEYSTPVGDKNYYDRFLEFKDDWEFLSENLSTIDPKNEEIIKLVLEQKEWDEAQTKILKDYCEVTYKSDEPSLHPGFIYSGLRSKKLSPHPNDNIHRRWGIIRGKKTTCKKWY